VYIPEFTIFKTVKDGEKLNLCGMSFTVIATPGHTAGGVCYQVEGNLFTGDTLFCESVGRCDLPTGNARQLTESVKKLYALKGDYKVYCGHEEDTTLNHERECNPYVRG
jgi:glyoxylase-like metal-dependent hydrolase (beta-lactamase superfamily II)